MCKNVQPNVQKFSKLQALSAQSYKSYARFLFQSGLKVGDMILAINTETFLGISYDEVNTAT